MPEVIELKHGKCADTECSVNTFGATVVSWKVDGVENIFVSSLAKTDGTKGGHASRHQLCSDFSVMEIGIECFFRRMQGAKARIIEGKSYKNI